MALRKLTFVAAALAAGAAFAAEPVVGPSATGQSGLLNMPDARIAPEGTWRSGVSFMRPYQAVWMSMALFPWLETSFRYTRIMHVPGFAPGPGIDYGDYKDKSLDLKLQLLPERGAWPSVVVGGQDLQGTDIFRAFYGAASKQVGNFDLTLGYGSKRIDGVFGGVRYTDPRLPNWSLVAEYDAFDYKHDFQAALSGAADYSKAPAAGIEYRSRWWGAKAYAAHGEAGVNAWVSVPLEAKEFVPKIDEPPPFTRIVPRPTEAQWAESREHRARLARALYEQDFRDLRIAYANGVLSAELSNIRISSMPRAVGRAARTLLSFAPLEVREIRVTYLEAELPIATYDFVDVPLLQRYFNGMASRAMLAPTVAIEYAKPGGSESADRDAALAAFEEPIPERLLVQRGVEGNYFSLRDEDVLGGTLLLHPALSAYFNDPSGALKFDLSAVASYERWFPARVQLLGDLQATVWENVSDVTEPSDSLLPHVRTDIAEYKRERGPRILRLVANKFFQPARRVYARVSGGIYEEMYDGVGGQVLYLPRDGRWATDVALDAVRQRDFRGLFGTRDYSTVTAIASLNYRLAKGVTATARAGRFLAKDEGVRFEIKRRFASGSEVGAWYTFTNGNDITTPGSPSSPYHDKGIFMSIPLDTLLTQDTRAVAGFSLAPWTRDVGQMVASPGDLYRLTESDVLQMHEHGGLSRFGDRDDDYTLPELGTVPRARRWPDFVAGDAEGMAQAGGQIDWWKTALIGAGLTLASTSLDTRAYRFATDHQNASWMKDGVRLGNALPLAALGLSAMFAFDDSRPRLSDAGTAALEGSGVALLASLGLKYAVGRARPSAGLGKADFSPGSSEDRYHSFPSNHTVAIWAAVTPYAEEFGMPWLYGAAALTNLARIGSRGHWVSDTVAGSLIGYGLGYLAWDAQHQARLKKDGPTVLVGPQSVNLAWQLD